MATGVKVKVGRRWAAVVGGRGGRGGRWLQLLGSCVGGQLTFGRRASFAFGGEERGEALEGGGGGVLAVVVVDAVGDDAGQGGGGGGDDGGGGGCHVFAGVKVF